MKPETYNDERKRSITKMTLIALYALISLVMSFVSSTLSGAIYLAFVLVICIVSAQGKREQARSQEVIYDLVVNRMAIPCGMEKIKSMRGDIIDLIDERMDGKITHDDFSTRIKGMMDAETELLQDSPDEIVDAAKYVLCLGTIKEISDKDNWEEDRPSLITINDIRNKFAKILHVERKIY